LFCPLLPQLALVGLACDLTFSLEPCSRSRKTFYDLGPALASGWHSLGLSIFICKVGALTHEQSAS
jgi:hypothetical protein